MTSRWLAILASTGIRPPPVNQTVNLNMSWGADKTIDTPPNGNMTFGGNITSSANALFKIDAGTLTLGGNNALAAYEENGGTNIITGTTTITGTGGSRVYVGDGDAINGCNGTLIIQPGAVFNMIGTYADAFVLGRDSGSGKIIQNGGRVNLQYGQPNSFPHCGDGRHAHAGGI